MIELLILALLGGGMAAYAITIGQIDFTGRLNAQVNEDMDTETAEVLEGYTNIALFGLDNRVSGETMKGRSDTIMIASIDNATKEVRLLSIYRDTYLKVSDEKYYKINNAFATGGVQGAVNAINVNLDLDIQDYICVDWLAVVQAIDAMGGLDLTITEEEMKQINQYKVDVDKMTGYSTPSVTEFGEVHLDGTQATTYARIRKTKGSDYLRTSRQRIVLQEMLKKAKAADPATLVKTAGEVFDDVSTSLTLKQITGLLAKVGEYEIVSTTGFPFTLTDATVDKASCVVPIDLEENVCQLHSWLFADEEYSPSATVAEISEHIMEVTGVTADAYAENTSLYNETVGAVGTEDAKDRNRASE